MNIISFLHFGEDFIRNENHRIFCLNDIILPQSKEGYDLDYSYEAP